jgi:hypothetical protein
MKIKDVPGKEFIPLGGQDGQKAFALIKKYE